MQETAPGKQNAPSPVPSLFSLDSLFLKIKTILCVSHLAVVSYSIFPQMTRHLLHARSVTKQKTGTNPLTYYPHSGFSRLALILCRHFFLTDFLCVTCPPSVCSFPLSRIPVFTYYTYFGISLSILYDLLTDSGLFFCTICLPAALTVCLSADLVQLTLTSTPLSTSNCKSIENYILSKNVSIFTTVQAKKKKKRDG